jgi:hypothetical protein
LPTRRARKPCGALKSVRLGCIIGYDESVRELGSDEVSNEGVELQPPRRNRVSLRIRERRQHEAVGDIDAERSPLRLPEE